MHVNKNNQRRKQMKNCRIIKTVFYSAKAKEILSSVIGQWSDGIYENSNRMNKYWMFADIITEANGQVCIKISKDRYDKHYEVINGFIAMSDIEVKEFFAKYIKAIAKIELHDNKIQNGWKRNGAFDISYLSYNENITVAHVYALYEIMLGRKTLSKYDKNILDEIYGSKKDADETAAEMTKRNAIAELEKQYNEDIARCDAEYDAAVKVAYENKVNAKKVLQNNFIKACNAIN